MDYTNSEIRKSIANSLKELRELYDLKQKNVSEILGVDPASYRNWENERSTPSISMLYEIAKIYKVSINRICGLEEKNTVMKVESPNEYNKSFYGESKITDLDNYEKQLVMQIRRLTNEDKRKVGKCITDLLKEREQTNE